jgi:hypothetical protein
LTDTLESNTMASLIAIAEQCPLEGGDAVYEARAIVSHFTGQGFNDREQCADNQRQQQPEYPKINPEINSVTVYPNPTTGQLYWSGTGEQSVTIRVFNSLGQLVAETTSNTGYANLERLPDGLYQLQLSTPDNKVLATQKLQIIRH